jgi:hypothetical protein
MAPDTELWDGDPAEARSRFLSLAQLCSEHMPPALLNRMAATMALWLDAQHAARQEPAGYAQRLAAQLKHAWLQRLAKHNPN